MKKAGTPKNACCEMLFLFVPGTSALVVAIRSVRKLECGYDSASHISRLMPELEKQMSHMVSRQHLIVALLDLSLNA